MEDTSSGVPAGPLDGLRVIDVTTMISGGFATGLLADFGADVVKLEHPEYPDPIRDWPPFDQGESLRWKSLGRNKRCATLNLSTEEGAALLLELVEDADFFVENFRPGTLERWGIGPDTLLETNPELIVVRISGYGQTGPRKSKPGFGSIAESISGWCHTNGFPDREPLLPPLALADLTAAQFAVQGALYALFEREIGDGGSGSGQVVDVSLYEPLFRLFFGDPEAYDRVGKVRSRMGNRHASAAPRNIYETADGFITLSASSQRIFENVMDAIGRPELVEDSRFENNDKRVANVDELDEVIESWTRERPTDVVLEEMGEADAIVGPVYDIADIFEDEQYAAREDIVEVPDPDFGSLKTFGTFPKLSRTPGSVRHTGPAHGEHSVEVFQDEVGLSETEFARLRDSKVI